MSTSNETTLKNKLKNSSLGLAGGVIGISTVFIALFFAVLASNNQLADTLSKVMFG